MKFYHLLLATSLLASATYANQPSFDCTKVKKDSPEGLICASDQLMNLDRKLADIYKKALAKTSKSDSLKATQRGWIKGRNDCGKAEDEQKCMVSAYNQRIHTLTKTYTLSSKKGAQNEPHSKGFDKVLKLQGVVFHVQATNKGSLNHMTISPSGLKGNNAIIKEEIDGAVANAEVGDLNRDGFPELYVYVTSAGSGAYGSLLAYSSNHNQSITPIYLPPLEDNKKANQGYMGHDEFTLIENTLARRFPVYLKDDANCCPKGGTRQLEYKLVPGEANWQLKLIKSTTSK